MICLAIGAILLSLAGIVVSVYRIVNFGIREFADALQSPFLILVCLFCIVLICSIFIKSQYVVDDTHYTTQFGFIKSKYEIKNITSLSLDMDTKKLTVYFGEEFTVLSLNPTWQDEFIAAIRAVNPEIEFTFTLAENKPDEENK